MFLSLNSVFSVSLPHVYKLKHVVMQSAFTNVGKNGDHGILDV